MDIGKFQSKINESVSVGDLLYIIIPSQNINAVASSSAANSVITEVGEEIDYANLVAFLASDRSGYITGTAINLDGGLCPVV